VRVAVLVAQARERALRPRAGGPVLDAAAVAEEREGHLRMRERHAAKRVQAVRGLGGVGFQELAPRRRARKEVLDLDRRAGRGRRRRDPAGLGVDGPGVRLAGGAADDADPRHRGDRGERLAAKAQRAHLLQRVERVDLAGRVAGERQRQLVAGDAAAVVADRHAAHAAVLDAHLDALRARVDRVLEQLLDHRGGTLDHLAGGDLVDQRAGQQADGARGRAVGVGSHRTSARVGRPGGRRIISAPL
jgi:hypothetical protein